MDAGVRHQDLQDVALTTILTECGPALCRKHSGQDPFFEPDAYRAYAENLINRMTSPLLQDEIDRVLRDMERKLGWDDRMAGAIRLCLDQGITPSHLLAATKVAARTCFGSDRDAVDRGLAGLWRDAPTNETIPLIELINLQRTASVNN